MAAFVHPRVGGKVLKASGYKTESYKPPLVNPCDITTADRYMTRMPGEDLYSGETPAQRSAQQLMEEYSRLNDATTRREEWMAVQAIVTGQVPVVGEGVNEIIDFGFTNKVTLEGTKQWGKSAAAILENLEDWVDKVLVEGFANCDMVGHTGVYDAACKAVATVDECVGKVVEATSKMGGVSLITADHGNAEKMVDEKGEPFTAHTTNVVPFVAIGCGDVKLREGGCLADIAPTMLPYIGLPVPAEMTGKSIIAE